MNKNFVLLIALIGSFYCNVYLFVQNQWNGKIQKIQDIQISVLKDQMTDLQYTNQQVMSGGLNINGYSDNKVNIETIKYSSYTTGYNDAIEHVGKNYPNSGYAAGYHAAIEQFETKKVSTNQ